MTTTETTITVGERRLTPQQMLDELDRLGLSLSRQRHQWTHDERRAYNWSASRLREAIRDSALLDSPAFTEAVCKTYDLAITTLAAAAGQYKGAASASVTETGDGDALDLEVREA